MRRKDRQVFGEDMNAILLGTKVLRLAMTDGLRPYVVPLNFGVEFEGQQPVIYLHSAVEGRKLDILRANPAVCFEVDGAHALIEREQACAYGFAYESVIGDGRVEFVVEPLQKARALRTIMRHQAGIEVAEFSDAALASVCVLRIVVSEMTGKRCGA